VQRCYVSGMAEIRVTSGDGFLQHVQAGRHSLLSDEPVSMGGRDEGLSPYDLICAALGSCTGMTLRVYARTKGWPLREVTVRVSHEKIHAIDCAECETKEGRIDKLTREISLTGELTEAQRQRLLEIADRCPVHRTLTNEVRIETRLTAS
jgi:uncharacterized OsmC-like protein